MRTGNVISVAEIVADGLAEVALPRREIEHVVGHLKGNAEVAAETVERLLLPRGRSARTAPMRLAAAKSSAVSPE